MKNIKVSMAPPYRTDQENYVSKIEASFEFDDAKEALAFEVQLIQLISKFQDISDFIYKE